MPSIFALLISLPACFSLSNSFSRGVAGDSLGHGRLFSTRPRAAIARAPTATCSEGDVNTQALYGKIDDLLRRARKPGVSSLTAQVSRSLGQKWLTISPEELVEATMICGTLVLEGFDEGLDIVVEAEDAGVKVSSKAYYALMRLALSEQRPLDALALFARTMNQNVERTEGLLLCAMQSAAEVGDWGAVARLYTELTEGPEAAARQAIELEAFTTDPTVLQEIRQDAIAVEKGEDTDAPSPAEALSLALRAHCERGDVQRTVDIVRRKRIRGNALSADEYALLADLAKRTGRSDVILALRPVDVVRTVESAVEPQVFALTNRLGLLMSGLGSVERVIAIGSVGALLLVTALSLTGALDAVTSLVMPPAADPMDPFNSPLFN